MSAAKLFFKRTRTQGSQQLQLDMEASVERTACSGQILVVDDEKNYRIILKRLLKDAGYQVFIADGPEACLAILREQSIDLVISDLQLAGLDGVGLCRQIYTEIGPLPCIVFSAYLSPRSLQAMNETGIVGYLSKPFDNRELLSLIDRVLGTERTCSKPVMFIRQPE